MEPGPVDELGRPLASVRKRIAAMALDVALFGLTLSLINALLAPPPDQDPGGDVTFAFAMLLILFFGIYSVVLNGMRRGQTLGKMALHIALRRSRTSAPVGIGRSFIRSLISYFLGGLWPSLLALVTPQRQTLQDIVMRTVVIDLKK